jgi:hypothetical protein
MIKNEKGVVTTLGAFIIAIIAFMIALGAMGYSYVDSLETIQGEQGPIGLQGPKGDTGAIGATGPQGPIGPAGTNGKDLISTPPVMTAHTMDGSIKMCDDWVLSVTLDNPDNTQMKVEFYLYVETEWLDCLTNYMSISCFDYTISDLMGNHIWLPFYNEVGYDGTYSFNATNIRDVLGCYHLLSPCDSYKWRVDVTDCGCFWSKEFTFNPDCDPYDYCDCCWICSELPQ